MNDVKRALVRKFGPLPAWAWAGIAGGALYFYRRSKSGAGALGAANVPATSSPDVTDQTGGLQPPVTLDPGQSVYDPNTQRLLGPGDAGPPDQTPGDTGGGGGGGTDNGAGGARPRKPKAKPKHVRPGKPSVRDRVRAAKHVVRRAKPGKPTIAKPKAAPGRTAKPAAAQPKRGRVSPPPEPALRQRPAAPRVVDHAEQKVVTHPAAPPKGAARAKAPAKAPARRRP